MARGTSTTSPKKRDGFYLPYGLAHGGKSLFWHSSELLFAYFLTDGCGLPAQQMGLVLGVSLVVSAVADLFVGRVLVRLRTTIQAARVQWWGTVASGAAFTVFGLAALTPHAIRFPFAMATLIFFRVLYAFIDNPQNAMLALATRTDTERARLSSARYIFGGASKLLVAAAFVPLLKTGSGAIDAPHFAFYAWFVTLAALVSAHRLRAHVKTAAAAQSKDTPAPAPPRGHTEGTLKHWHVLVAMFFISAGTSVFSLLEPYFITSGPRPIAGGWILLVCVALGTVMFQPVWATVARRHSILTTSRIAALTLIAGATTFGFTSTTGIVACAASGFLYGVGSGGVLMSLWALTAAAASAGRQSGGATATFASLTFSSKMALALSAFGAGAFLSGLNPQGRAQTIPVLMAFLPALSALICLALTCLKRPVSVRWTENRNLPIPQGSRASPQRRGPCTIAKVTFASSQSHKSDSSRLIELSAAGRPDDHA